MSVRSVYFFCAEADERYHFDIIPLAEGLRAVGVICVGNRPYWRNSATSDATIIEIAGNRCATDCDALVFPVNYFACNLGGLGPVSNKVPSGLLAAGRRHRVVFLDSHDGFDTVSRREPFRGLDLILRSHFNRRCPHPSNTLPWAFGLSERILMACGEPLPWHERKATALSNFGVTHGYTHGCREVARHRFLRRLPSFLEIDTTTDDLGAAPSNGWHRLMWEQTWRRHSPQYYERLRRTQACACFCGDLVPPAPHDPGPLLEGGNRAKLRRWFWNAMRVFDPRPDRIIQWDSWRFWETLAAGAVAFHVDLEEYGAEMPVMPMNWEHYIGVDLRRPKAAIERIMDDPGCLERIASQGRAWALEHYSPRTVAERFLRLLGLTVPSSCLENDCADGG